MGAAIDAGSTGEKVEVTLNRVILLLLAVGVVAAIGLGFVGFSANRILSAKPVPLWQAGSPASLAIMAAGFGLLIAGALGRPRRFAHVATLTGATLVFLAAFATAGATATALVAKAASSTARVSLGGAFWVIIVMSSLAIAESLKRLESGLALRLFFGIATAGVLAAMAMSGWFDDLSLVREWANRREEYGVAVGEHIRLVLSALAIALAIGLPIGILATVRPALAGRIFAVLNLIQTIPSIALFGLLIGPLTALSEAVPGLRDLGVRGIGFTPALIALVLYGLLPIARNTHAGLLSVPASAIETARGMGMTSFQIITRVSVPLALPILLAGLRIVTVQLIGLTVVAALIGAGGLGSFVFVGLGQTAADLVLLGALSAILLALVADAALRLLTLASERAVGA
jgi:osmoprotectant transport system permease protein